MGIAGNVEMQGPIRSPVLNMIEMRGTVAIGASGVATLTGSPGLLTCVKSDTGDYDITFDAFPSGAFGIIEVGILHSPTPTVANVRIAASSLTSGTATFITFLNTAGTPVEPASGDILWIRISGSFAP